MRDFFNIFNWNQCTNFGYCIFIYFSTILKINIYLIFLILRQSTLEHYEYSARKSEQKCEFPFMFTFPLLLVCERAFTESLLLHKSSTKVFIFHW